MSVDLRSSMRRLGAGFALVVLLAGSAACGWEQWGLLSQTGGSPPQSHGGPVQDHVSFVDALRAAGYAVDPVGQLQQPFLHVPGTRLRISGADLTGPAEIQSYNYDDRDLGTDGLVTARADADQIQPDGQPRTARVTWNGPPHFFRKQRVLVIYVGDDPALLGVLTNLLGAQFAGR